MLVNVLPLGRQSKFTASQDESFSASNIGYAYVDSDSLAADSFSTLSPYEDDIGLGGDTAVVNFGPDPYALPSTINLSAALGTLGFRINGEAADDFAGRSLGAGDFNGDGRSDLLIGANFAGAANGGAAYVVFGTVANPGTVNLAGIPAATGFKINPEAGTTGLGQVSSAGDVNNDGIDDILVGATFGSGGAGAAYLIYGTSSGGTINLGSLGSSGIRMGGVAGTNAGLAVSAAGNITTTISTISSSGRAIPPM